MKFQWRRDALSVRDWMDRYVEKVGPPDKHGCWNWMGSTDKDGYGNFTIARKPIRAHRLAWEIEHGSQPGDLCVCHTCDNPSCVNPNHLWLGTNGDNTSDRNSKGRQAKGERNAGAKITLRDARWIRKAYAAGLGTHRQIAAHFGLGKTQVQRILARERWV